MPIQLVPEGLSNPEDEQMKMMQQLNAVRAKTGAQQVNLPAPKQGVLSQFGDMAKEKVMGDALNAGSKAVYDKGATMFASQAAPATMAQMAGPSLTAAGGAGLGAGIGPGMAGVAAPGLAGSAAGAGAAAGIGAAVPYIGAGLLAGKALGFFNNGGHVGPLYAADGKMAYPSYKSNYSNLSDDEILKLDSEEQDDYIKTIGIEEAMDAMYNYKGGMAGPLSKIEYKSAGGEVYKLSYGGGPLKKEK